MGILFLLPIVLLALAAYTHRAQTEMQGTRGENFTCRALYIAHAGVQRAGQALLLDPDYRGSATDVPFGGGTYSYIVQGDEVFPELATRFRIVATGSYDDPTLGVVDRDLTVIVYRTRERSVLDYHLSAGDTIRSTDSAVIGGPFDSDYVLYAGRLSGYQPKTAWFEGAGNTLYGTVDLATTVPQSYPPNGDDSRIEYGVDPLSFPTFDVDALRAKAIANGTYYSGPTTFEDETLTGVIFVEGGSVLIEGTVVVDGCLVQNPLSSTYSNMEVQRGARLTIRPDDDPDTGVPGVAMIKLGDHANSNIAFEERSRSDIEGYIFSEGNVELEYGSAGSLSLRGAIIAEGDQLLRSDSRVTVSLLDPGAPLGDEVWLDAEPILAFATWLEG